MLHDGIDDHLYVGVYMVVMYLYFILLYMAYVIIMIIAGVGARLSYFIRNSIGAPLFNLI
jgi:hypothetical protein